jgi:hypothetical protein
MPRSLTSRIALSALTAGVLLATPVGDPAFGGSAAPATEATPFALAGNGFGSLVQGGQVPAGSDESAYQVIGCTNRAGIARENHEASVTVPGLGVLNGVATQVWTQSNGGVVSSYSRHTIADLTLVQSSLGSLELTAISSLSRAFHNATGFHSATATDVGSITFTPAGGDPMSFPAPTPNQPVTIPGLATIAVGGATNVSNSTGAKAAANALDIKVIPTDTRARVAHTATQISSGVKIGVFAGWSSSSRASGLQDNVTSGATPLQVMPCEGTGGVVRYRSIAHVDLGGQAVVRGLTTQQMSQQTATKASGYEGGKAKGINLGNGQLVVHDIRGRANVERTASGVTSNAKGTTIGEILVNGEVRALPDSGVLEIPGVARLETSIVKRSANGISVTALRITLLDGTLAVINLGQAKLTINRSGL